MVSAKDLNPFAQHPAFALGLPYMVLDTRLPRKCPPSTPISPGAQSAPSPEPTAAETAAAKTTATESTSPATTATTAETATTKSTPTETIPAPEAPETTATKVVIEAVRETAGAIVTGAARLRFPIGP